MGTSFGTHRDGAFRKLARVVRAGRQVARTTGFFDIGVPSVFKDVKNGGLAACLSNCGIIILTSGAIVGHGVKIQPNSSAVVQNVAGVGGSVSAVVKRNAMGADRRPKEGGEDDLEKELHQ